MEEPVFNDSTEEAQYWRQKAEEYRLGMEEAREELEDFQISSRELELELETQLQQLEKRNGELVLLSEKLTNEKENYRNRLENNQEYVNHEIVRLQDELEKIKLDREKMQKYIRELEQINDDLERTKRATVVTLEDFEYRLNQAIERNAFLESELDEQRDLIVTVQRLKDETRDLHQELAITRRQPESKPSTEMNGNLVKTPTSVNGTSVASRSTQDCIVQTDNSCFYNSLLTPSVRLSALNMVNDALQKVGQLEDKLSILYRAYGNPPLSAPAHGFQTSSTAHGTYNKSSVSDSKRLSLRQQRLSTQSWTNGSVSLDRHTIDSGTCENHVRVAL